MTSLFSIYSNAREYDNPFPDMFGRSRIYNAGNRDIFSPIISKHLFDEGFRPYYPDNKNFAVCVSHDIDHLYLQQTFNRKLVNAAKDLLKGNLKSSRHYLSSTFSHRIHEQYSLEKMIELDNSYGIRSSNYFLALSRHDRDYNYDVSKIHWLIERLAGNKCEIALHGGHDAFNNLDKLVEEKNRLQDASGIRIEGYRSHYLRFDLPGTWNNLSQAGFLYDTTLAYADCVGFRNGMCYPYYPYDLKTHRFIDIIELPLVVMDATLFYYMRLDSEMSLKICTHLIEKVREYKGVFTLLWHNNLINGEMGDFYKKLLGLLKQEDPWFATSSELVKWWQQENFLEKSKQAINALKENESASI